MKSEKIIITLPDGTNREAQAPLIISASRATDIPAFYSDWFFNRLQTGYARWRNPFNGRDLFVSFTKTCFIVFWSKNPEPIIPYLPILRAKGIGCYFQFTLNDYGREKYEPNIPKIEQRIDTFKKLVDTLGVGSVVWRFDPLVLTDKVDEIMLLERIKNLAQNLKGYSEKLVFSFADISNYLKVARNLSNHGVYYREWTEEGMCRFAQQLNDLDLGLQLSTCAEKVDLSAFNISHNRCIDPDLICRISPELFDEIGKLKNDKGQRKLCGCISSKDIGVYNTCPHGCVYCYANSTPESAMRNFNKHLCNPFNDSIL